MFRDPEKQPAGVNFTFPLVTVVLAEIHGFTLVVDWFSIVFAGQSG